MIDHARIQGLIHARVGRTQAVKLSQLLVGSEFERIYGHIQSHPGCRQVELGRAVGAPPSRLGRCLHHAAGLGIIRRERSGRSYLLFDGLTGREVGTGLTGRRLGCFLDTETTGLDRNKDEVIELALLLFEFDAGTGEIVRVVERYAGQRYPSVAISPDSTRVHGMTRSSLAGAALDTERVESILARAEVLVAHHAAFDHAMLARLFPSCKTKDWYCSMKGVNWRGHGFRTRGLQKLLALHGVNCGTAHRADSDAQATMDLLAKRSPAGSRYFAELLHHGPLIARKGAGGADRASAPNVEAPVAREGPAASRWHGVVERLQAWAARHMRP